MDDLSAATDATNTVQIGGLDEAATSLPATEGAEGTAVLAEGTSAEGTAGVAAGEGTAAAADPKKPQAPRRRGVYDTQKNTVTVVEPSVEDVTFDINALPEAVKQHCLLHGAWMIMRAAENPKAGYDAMLSGKTVEVKPVAVDELSPWKQAVAATLVDMTKKHPEPMTLEQANAKVAGLSRKQMADARNDPAVVKHFHKMFPKAADAAPSTLHSLIA